MKLSFCKRVAIVIPVFFIFLFNAFSQTITEKKSEASPWGFKLSGFVRNDAMIDSRQTVNSTEGDIVMYPADIAKDINNVDKNAAASFNMLPISTRLTGTITGPDAFGAKASAILEGEFFGFGNGTTSNNVFGLRHAFIKLDWPRTQLGFGQYWHPLYNPECAPGQLGFSGGMPFVPFNRSPQIRLTQKLNKQFSFILAAVTERDFQSVIPATTSGVAGFTATGVNSSDGMRNAVVPDLNAQLLYKSDAVLVGAALDYKSLRPALAVGTGAGSISTKRVNSLAFEMYGKVTTRGFVLKAEYVSGQNMTDLIMLGGYVAYGSVPDISYKPTSVSSCWLDICGTGKKVVPGIFAGYTKNDGASDIGGIASYGRGLSVSATGRGIDHVMRVAPRIEFVSGKFKFGTELEVTTAAYGYSMTSADITGSTDLVTNVRGLFVTSFSF
jgi:hypothetical protein